MRHASPIAVLLVCTALNACNRFAEQPSAPPPATSLTLSAPVDHVDKMAREAMLVEHPDGALFVTGYGGPAPVLWKSTDGGATWASVPVGTPADGAVGNSDVDLAVAPDGTLYFVAMTFDRTTYEGTQIAIGSSRDAGTTWSWTNLSKSRYDDRPWVEVTPDGVAHAIWNDGGGVAYAVSRDRGLTWTEQPRIHPQGGSSHLAVGPAGEIAVRITPVSASANVHHAGVDLVAVSVDGGASWTKAPAPSAREWTFPFTENDPMPRWVEPVAWDAAGALYTMWTTPDGLWLARSQDRGANWKSWRLAEGGDLRYFPYLVARGNGELAASWYSSLDRVDAHVARIHVPDGDGAPLMSEAPPFQVDAWRFGAKPGETPKRDTAGEYLPIAFLRDGRLVVLSTIQNPEAKRFGFSFRATVR